MTQDDTLIFDQCPGDIINAGQAARIVGCHPDTIAKLIDNGTCPGRKIGREYKIPKETFRVWLNGSFKGEVKR